MALNWLQKGSHSEELAKKAAEEAERVRGQRGKLWRFFVKEGQEARITFLDGALSDEGFLLPPRFFEHTIKHNGRWTNFVCPEKTNPHDGGICPLCEQGDRPSLVAVFTIIDHRVSSSKDGAKTYKDQKRLYTAKQQTFEMLNKLAAKRDGLTGTTWDVSRVGDKSPAAGNMFDFVEKHSLKDLQAAYMDEVEVDGKKETKTYAFPAAYEEEIEYHSGDDLRALLGHSNGGATAGSSKNYEAEL